MTNESSPGDPESANPATHGDSARPDAASASPNGPPEHEPDDREVTRGTAPGSLSSAMLFDGKSSRDTEARGADDEDRHPLRIAGYRIDRVLGRGGMGVVYRAEQDNPRRTVALKVLRSRLSTPEVRRRFDYEVALLGRLRHPGIASIHEAGSTADTDGSPLPFFAMELVEGTTLVEHARGAELSLEERLRLFTRVCEAVHFAHQQGIIHRDLKPSNLMVDSLGAPRVLDFGIARSVDRSESAPAFTEIGQTPGTLPYMSPEQLSGDPDSLDTRTDVYSLGVVLYELLTGNSPYDLEGKPPLACMRAIREEEPRRPTRSDRRFPADVETILLKALAKEKERRYASAAALGADLERFLAHEPIEARPASAWYVARKFARRQPALVAAAAVVALALVTATAVSLDSAARARRSEARERIAAENARKSEREAIDAQERERIAAENARESEREARAAETEAKELQKRENEARREAENALSSSAAIASEGGMWEATLEATEKALEFSPPNEAELRLQRVKACLAINRSREAESELARLESLLERANPDRHGDIRAAAALWRGDLLLARSVRHAEGLRHIREALESENLSPADTAYAQALLAESSSEVVQDLERAVELEPSHFRANELLAFYLTLTGRRADAEKHRAILRAMYPEDDGEVALAALAAALNGDRAAAETAIDSLRDLEPATIHAIRELVVLISELTDIRIWVERTNRINEEFFSIITKLSTGLMTISQDPEANLLFPIPAFMPKLLQHASAGTGLVMNGTRRLVKADRGPMPFTWKAAAAEFEKAVALHDDALLHTVTAHCHSMANDEITSIEAARRAIDAPSLFRNLEPMMRARIVLSIASYLVFVDRQGADGSRHDGNGVDREALRKELAEHLARWHEVAPWPRPYDMQFMVLIALNQTGDPALTRKMSDDWIARAPDTMAARIFDARLSATDDRTMRALDLLEARMAPGVELPPGHREILGQVADSLEQRARRILETIEDIRAPLPPGEAPSDQ